jgi:beta-glucosidase
VDALKFWNQQMKYAAEPGKFNVFIGVDSARVNKGEFDSNVVRTLCSNN